MRSKDVPNELLYTLADVRKMDNSLFLAADKIR